MPKLKGYHMFEPYKCWTKYKGQKMVYKGNINYKIQIIPMFNPFRLEPEKLDCIEAKIYMN